MTKKMLVDATHTEETRVAVVDGQKLMDFDYESSVRKQLKGNIFLAKVTRVEPSLQAAFVNFGGNRHGFLPFSEIHPDYFRIPIADREALIAEQEEEMARQAAKEEAEDNADDNTDDEADDEVVELNAEENSDTDEEDDAKSSKKKSSRSKKSSEKEDTKKKPKKTAKNNKKSEEENSEDTSDSKAVDGNKKETTPDDDDSTPGNEVEAEIDESDDADGNQKRGGRSRGGRGGRNSRGRGGRNSRGGGGRGGRGRGGRQKYSSARSKSVEVLGGDGIEGDQPRRPSLKKKYKIQEVIKRGQIMLIQVSKEERGNKGAAVTSYLSLPGRYCVLMPNSPRGGGVSRKIANYKDRRRMREVLSELEVPQGMSVIMRTAGVERTKAEIKRDLDYLIRLWNRIREQTLSSSAPAVIHEEGNLIRKSIRDIYTRDIDEIHVSGNDGYKMAKDFMKMLIPSHAKKVKHYKDEKIGLFHRHQVENQISKIGVPEVVLPSGGYLVINPTEALVSVDVNSGRSTKERHIEETALKTNLEAAEEVARQLKLRDLGGLVVIDFIDMEDRRNNRKVEQKLKQSLSTDRARIQMGRISTFGLLELSRQRLNPSITEQQYKKCESCQGFGYVRASDATAIVALRSLEEEGIKNRSGETVLSISNEAALYILNQKRKMLSDIEERFNMHVTIKIDENPGPDGYKIEFIKSKDSNKDRDDSPSSGGSSNNDDDGNSNKKRSRKRGGRGRNKQRNQNNKQENDKNEVTSKGDTGEKDQESTSKDNTDNAAKDKKADRKKPSEDSSSSKKADTSREDDTKTSEKEDKGKKKTASRKKPAPAKRKDSSEAEDKEKSSADAPKKESKAKPKAKSSKAKTPAKSKSKASEKSEDVESSKSPDNDNPAAQDTPKDFEVVNEAPKKKKKGWWSKN